MGLIKNKGEQLYQKLKLSREQLVKKYTAGGTIRYDEAIGLIPIGGVPTLSQAATTLGGATVANSGRREKRVPDIKADGTVAAANGRVVLDLDAIKAANIADGVASGSMMDALKKRAEGKVVLLFANDAALRWGSVLLGEVECMLQLQDDITGAIRNGIFPTFAPITSATTGLIHSLPGLVENEIVTHRGLPKQANYRGDAEYLKNPTSIWATVDGSGLPIMLFGVNSEIRMWGANQVIDLNGKRIGAHERPNRVAAFSVLIDLSNGHFSGLSNKGARNAHIFSSTGVGRLARNNHFAIRGHFVKGLLVEGVSSGDSATLNHGSYFGTAMFNDSQEIVFRDVHQEMLNKAVSNSSMALSHYAQLTSMEYLLGYFERASAWSTASAAYPWMKWDNIASGAVDTNGNGKTTVFPVLKTESELSSALGANAANASRVHTALRAMIAAHGKSMKSADDTYIQVNTGHGIIGKTFPMVANKMTNVNQIPRSVNLIAQNPKNADGQRHPDSMAYGVRVGSAGEGVGKLAVERGGTAQDIYVIDCTFAGMHTSPMEMVSVGVEGKGAYKTFNGNGLRMVGYTNTLSDAASIAPALMLMSKEALEAGSPTYALESKPVDAIDTAAKAAANTSASGWTAAKASGLYKGNDVVEAGLAAVEAVSLLKKYFTAAAPAGLLGGLDNSNVDIGVLAWRRSMMVALDALTANHVGLKGGFKGDIIDGHTVGGTLTDKYAHGEIYPWFVNTAGTVDVDKDVILTQADVLASATKDRTLSSPYLAAELPAVSDSIYKWKLVSADTLRLVTADSETPVTYQNCADLLGFSASSAGTPSDMSATVELKLLRNFDGQNHVQKGIFGVRVDQASQVGISNVRVKDMETAATGAPVQGLGSVATQVAFGINAEDRPESGAADIHGVSLNGVTGVEVDSILVEGCESRGPVFGVEVAGQSSQVSVDTVRVKDLTAGASGLLAQPFGEQKVVGVRVLKGTSDVSVKNVTGSELTADRSDLAKVVEIESEESTLA